MNRYKIRNMVLVLCVAVVCLSCFYWIISDRNNSEVYNDSKTGTHSDESDYISCSYGPLVIKWNDKRFKEDDPIIVSINTIGGYPVPVVDYKEFGLSVSAIEKDNYHSSVKLSLSLDNDVDNGHVLVDIKTGDWYDRHGVYAIRTDRGVFIAGGYDAAWDNYFYSGYEDGLYSFEEYCRLSEEYTRSHQEDGVTTEIIIELPSSKASNANADTKSPVETTITGTLKWNVKTNQAPSR